MIEFAEKINVPIFYNWEKLKVVNLDIIKDEIYGELILSDDGNMYFYHPLNDKKVFYGRHTCRPQTVRATKERPFFEVFDVNDGSISINEVYDCIANNTKLYVPLNGNVKQLTNIISISYNIDGEFEVEFNDHRKTMSIFDYRKRQYIKICKTEQAAKEYILLEKL